MRLRTTNGSYTRFSHNLLLKVKFFPTFQTKMTIITALPATAGESERQVSKMSSSLSVAISINSNERLGNGAIFLVERLIWIDYGSRVESWKLWGMEL